MVTKLDRFFRKIVNKWPGKQRFGVYRFLPAFLLLGAGLEFCMIRWHVGEVNFYRIYKRNQIKKIIQAEIDSGEL
ncbi:ubiquinol-cytochrome c reductase complex assembly factor 5-like isoform X1 [Tubulanus polymorphus]|uniref:ubiquinol-cytochrome c reductase complex assembly factor 5-like isoform X1 n=1 Tax=Tubulanus polymorphus TaxID=672921 RepID=UPI003DA62160